MMNKENVRLTSPFTVFSVPLLACLLAMGITGCASPPGDSSQAQTAETRQIMSPTDINSLASADLALAQVAAERKRAEREFEKQERVCFRRFFMTACLDEAREKRRAALARTRVLEVEANAFMRRARAAERDQALSDKKDKDEARAAEKSSASGAVGRGEAAGQAGPPASGPRTN
jgi:colicin import membrane protein